MTTVTQTPIYAIPPSRALPVSVPRTRRPVKLVRVWRTEINGVAVGAPSRVNIEASNLADAALAMVDKIIKLHQAACVEMFKLRQKIQMLESATGLAVSESSFSEQLASSVYTEGQKEALLFLAMCAKRHRPFPQSDRNKELVTDEFLKHRESDPNYAFSAANLMAIYDSLVDTGAIQITDGE